MMESRFFKYLLFTHRKSYLNKVHIAAAEVNFATREIDLSIIDQQLRKNFISIKILWGKDFFRDHHSLIMIKNSRQFWSDFSFYAKLINSLCRC